MYRLALDYLQDWKTRKNRLPLLIRGARQVGKTWLVREHAKAYADFIEINLESHPEYINVFKESYGKPRELLNAISLLSGQKIEAGETLLFIDEIQGCKEALLSLRYFKENLGGQHVIAAGSLLEFAFRELSYPVGRLEFFHLFPMNFEELLLALNHQKLIEAVASLSQDKPLSQAVHEKLLDKTALYCLIGGMPEVVKTYTETGDLRNCQGFQQILAANLREDFYKYASRANIEHLRILFQGAPRLLGQKFKYSNIDANIKSRELSSALRLLEQAGLLYRAYHTCANGLPLASQINPKKFKVFCLDIGLCHRLLGLNLSQLFLERKELLANRGAVAEQFAAQELISFTPQNQTPQIFYWHREARSSQAEVDLLTEYQGNVLPIEVKSSGQGSLKSLRLFLAEKEKFAPKGIKVSTGNFAGKDNVVFLPAYGLLKLRRHSL
ncbi:MAG: ATP-binding protein [Elusimicrobia bacterium]|nr:ATP-binding protein [Elusimicrobiota bacterium]